MGLLRFATFTLDASGSIVKQGDRLLMLRRQPFKVLSYLVEHPGRLVTNRELIEACWENPRGTSLNSLAQCIKAIREALGEADQEIIRTVHGQGYVFTAQVTAEVAVQVAAEATAESANDQAPISPPPPEEGVLAGPPVAEEHPAPAKLGWAGRMRGPWQALAGAIIVVAVLLAGGWELRGWLLRPGAPTMMAVPSIAVLPFEAVGGDVQTSDVGALSDDIMTDLARVPRGYALRIESTSVDKLDGMPLRNVGRRLGVRYLVTGTVRRDGHARQINVQLIEAESGRAVWAELFDHPLGESGAETRTAETIARAVGGQVLHAESRLPLPAHPEAGHFVILGRSIIAERGGRDGNRRALAFFDQARALDPNLIPALLGYGRTRVNMVLNGWASGDEARRLLDEAGPAVARATQLGPRDVSVQVLRGAYLRARGRDEDAIAALSRAVELLPTYALARAELGRAKIELGQTSEAVADLEEAIRLSPNDPYITTWYFWAGMAEAHAGHYKSAIKWLVGARTESRVHSKAAVWLAIAHGGLEEWSEARTYFKQHLNAVPTFSLANWNRTLPSRNPVVGAQRARLVAILCHLGTPGCTVTTTGMTTTNMTR